MLKKAFDTVDRDILLSKMNLYGTYKELLSIGLESIFDKSYTAVSR